MISPLGLCGKAGYSGGLSVNSYFCWRYYILDGIRYLTLTIEDSKIFDGDGENIGFGCVRPRDFVGCPGYRDSISSTLFNWRRNLQ